MQSNTPSPKRGRYVSSGKRSVPRHSALSRQSADRLERAFEKKERQDSKRVIKRALKDDT